MKTAPRKITLLKNCPLGHILYNEGMTIFRHENFKHALSFVFRLIALKFGTYLQSLIGHLAILNFF